MWKGTILPFFHSDGNEPLLGGRLNIKSKGLKMIQQYICNVQILILLCPWVLLGSRPCIILFISSVENVKEDKPFIGVEVKTSWKFAAIGHKGTLFGKGTVEKFSIFLEVC